MAKALLFDSTACVGCKECESACATANGLPYDETIAAETKTSAHKYTSVVSYGDEKYMRKLCMHCDDPSCASVCPVGALVKTAAGPVTYDADKCMGCRYCMVACPFDVPKYEWSKAIPAVRKCILCSDRVENGQQTACAEACPTGATVFGDRETLLAEARKRIRENPTQYVNYVYGEREVGGTSVLKIASQPFGTLGLKTNLGTQPLPPLTGRVLEHIPDVVTVGVTLLGGIYWITNRRAVVSSVENQSAKSEEKE